MNRAIEKILLGCVLLTGAYAEDTMKYIDMAVTKLIKNQKQMMVEIDNIKSKNNILEVKLEKFEKNLIVPVAQTKDDNSKHIISGDIKEFIFEK